MKGKISIGKVTCSDTEDYVRVELTDESSSIQFVTAKMSLLNFAKVITGQGYLEIDYELRGLDKVGKKLEVKNEEVNLIDGDNSDAAIRGAVARFETELMVGKR
jgi:hypothetical protein